MKRDTPHILLINPWIHDFAAYDFWAKPLGLLMLAGILRSHGFNISYVDCLDRFHPRETRIAARGKQGRGAYRKTLIPKPKRLEDIPRNYSRYGIRPDWLRADLSTIPTPHLVLMTSLMTYWYPGVQETVRVVREIFPDTPIVLGGIYAGLCRTHAEKHAGVDRVITGPGEDRILRLISQYTAFRVHYRSSAFDAHDPDTYPYPAFDLQHRMTYISLLTSKGCPFECAYCASHLLNPVKMRRSPDSVVEEICYWNKDYGLTDFAFYDDALLFEAHKHAIPLLEKIIATRLRIRFHTPNALHIRWISKKTARLMFKAGFDTLRLGLESGAFEGRQDLDRKVTQSEFQRAVSDLKAAGFRKNQLGAYLLIGLPHQKISDVEMSINMVKESGLTPVPAYYSPIPHTALWEKAVAASRYDLESDPIFTNNAIMPCQKEPFSWQNITSLKKAAE